jgi:hypothetical protein
MPYPILQPDSSPSAPADFDEGSTAQDAQVRALMKRHNLAYAEAVTLWISTGNAAGYEPIANRPELAPLAIDSNNRLLPFTPTEFSPQSLGDDKLVRQCARDWGMTYEATALELIKQGAIVSL